MTETVSLTEAARRTGISRRTLGRMIASGRLPGTRVDGGYEVPVEALDGLTSSSSPEADPSAEEVAKLTEALAEKDRELSEARTAITDLDKRLGIAEARLEERDALKDIVPMLTAMLGRQQMIDATTSTTANTTPPAEPYSEPKRNRFGRKRRGTQ